MTVKVNRADGQIELFETSSYRISEVKDFHPAIISVKVYVNGKCKTKRKRPFSWFYKKFTYKSEKVQQLLKQIAEMEQKQMEKENE